MAKANTAVVVLERGRRTTAAQLRRDASLAVFSPPPGPGGLASGISITDSRVSTRMSAGRNASDPQAAHVQGT